jgi:hypothetical protein
MMKFLDDIRTYFEKYSLPTIGAFEEIRGLSKPEWAKAACIWLQHDGRFDDSLPISFNWIDEEGGIAAVSDDPLVKVQTKPWSYGDAPSWSHFDQTHGWESEDLMRLTICHWVRDCWNMSGSDSFQLPVAIHDQAQCNDYSMELGRFFTSEENWAKLKG